MILRTNFNDEVGSALKRTGPDKVRAPHWSCSPLRFLEEIRLAHGGTMILDEPQELSLDALRLLREPLAKGTITCVERSPGGLPVSGIPKVIEAPADFKLVLIAAEDDPTFPRLDRKMTTALGELWTGR